MMEVCKEFLGDFRTIRESQHSLDQLSYSLFFSIFRGIFEEQEWPGKLLLCRRI